MIFFQFSWKPGSLGCLKSALLAEELWTLLRIFCVSRHIWEFLVYFSETIHGYFERNGFNSLSFPNSVVSFPKDGQFQSMSTTYHSMLGVCLLHYLSSMCLSSRFLHYVSCMSWVRCSPRHFLLFFFVYKFIYFMYLFYLFIFGYVGSSLLHAGFL